MNNSWCV